MRCANCDLDGSALRGRPHPLRAIADDLPQAVAPAVIDFGTTVFLDNPHRVGKSLRDDLAGIWSPRRGAYRVLYRIREDSREVVVLRIGHPSDSYRPLS